MTSAPGAGASATPSPDSFREGRQPWGIAPFPVSPGGADTHKPPPVSLGHSALCQQRGNSAACESVSPAHGPPCGLACGLSPARASQPRQGPSATNHFPSHPDHTRGRRGSFTAALAGSADHSSGSTEATADARVPTGCLPQFHQPGSI